MKIDPRKALKNRFPHIIQISTKALSEEVFAFCEEELNLQFKIDFDVRAANHDYGLDFFFRNQEHYMVIKIKYSSK